jgi:hypothetical protein
LGMLGSLWDEAERAITEATAIVFVGYRFPQSDMFAKRRLLLPLASKQQGATHLRIHIVLGEPGKDTARLAHMTGEMCRRAGRDNSALSDVRALMKYTVTVHPLFTEDFFAVYAEDLL